MIRSSGLHQRSLRVYDERRVCLSFRIDQNFQCPSLAPPSVSTFTLAEWNGVGIEYECEFY